MQHSAAAAATAAVVKACARSAYDSTLLDAHPTPPTPPTQVCEEAPAAAAPEPPRRELPPVTRSREELLAMPVRELKQILTDRKIRWGSTQFLPWVQCELTLSGPQ